MFTPMHYGIDVREKIIMLMLFLELAPFFVRIRVLRIAK